MKKRESRAAPGELTRAAASVGRVYFSFPGSAWECMTWRLRLHCRPEFQTATGQSPEDMGSQAEPGNQEKIPAAIGRPTLTDDSMIGVAGRGTWRDFFRKVSPRKHS